MGSAPAGISWNYIDRLLTMVGVAPLVLGLYYVRQQIAKDYKTLGKIGGRAFWNFLGGTTIAVAMLVFVHQQYHADWLDL